MPTPPHISRLLAIAAIAMAGCALQQPGMTDMTSKISADSVTTFLHRFEALAEKEDFGLIRDMIHAQAYFRFNDGDYIGHSAIKEVFEKTWRGDPSVTKARFYLSDVVVLTTDHTTATATYTYHWEGSQGDRAFTIKGRGTRVLVHDAGGFKIIHEHLSRFPRPQ